MKKIYHFINGQEYISKSDRFGDIFNPASGEKIGSVSFANKDDVALAIQSASDAQKKWAATPPLARSRVMFKLKELILRDMDKLAFEFTNAHG